MSGQETSTEVFEDVSGQETSTEVFGLATTLSRQGRIYKGTDAEITNYPFMAAILKSSVFVCNGAVISKYYILSHSKCYDGIFGTT